MEIWRDIDGFGGCYQISNLGRIKSLKFGKENILKPAINSSGYYHTVLRKDGRNITVYIHRLVAQAFIPNPNNLPIINNKDEDKTNNRVENLEWCSVYYNLHYGSAIEKIIKSIKQHPYFNKPHSKP